MPIKETDFDGMANTHRYLANAETWLDAAAVSLDTTGKYTFGHHPKTQEIQSLAKSISRLHKKLLKLREVIRSEG